MNASSDPQPPTSHTSIRTDARLDATTRAKVDVLARRFHQPRAAVLCHIMQWRLQRGRTEKFDSGVSEGPVRYLYCDVDPAVHARVKKAVMAAGVKMAPWLRAMVRQITLADVPASWQEATAAERSHDSRIYGTRFMLRLDETSETKLQQFISHFGTSKADIIRQLIIQASPEDFPRSWHMRAAERSMPAVRQQTTHHRELTPSSIAEDTSFSR